MARVAFQEEGLLSRAGSTLDLLGKLQAIPSKEQGRRR